MLADITQPRKHPGVAKFGIALEWGSRGRWFESSHSDHKKSSYSFGMRGFLLICRTFADTAQVVLSLQARLAASCCVQRRRFE